jgi:Protein of unknown function, DUF417
MRYSHRRIFVYAETNSKRRNLINQLTTKFDATTGESNGTRLPAARSLMDRLAGVLIRLGILTEDLDYHLIRASMVIIFFFFGYQKWWAYEAERLIPLYQQRPVDLLALPGFWHARRQLVVRRLRMDVRHAPVFRLLE